MVKTLSQLQYKALKLYQVTNSTKHKQNERQDRISLYSDTGFYLTGFTVDTQHINGIEVHIITSKGYILIFNQRTQKHITTLSGRPAQIKRYFKQLHIKYNNNIKTAISIAHKRNQERGYNNK